MCYLVGIVLDEGGKMGYKDLVFVFVFLRKRCVDFVIFLLGVKRGGRGAEGSFLKL